MTEPMTFDPISRQTVSGQIREQHTFVMVSHDLAKGLELCSHALILAKGKVVLFDEREGIDQAEFAATYRQTVGMGVA